MKYKNTVEHRGSIFMSKRKKSAAEIKVKLVIGYLAGSRSEFVFTAFFVL